jgi:hypothetical protein
MANFIIPNLTTAVIGFSTTSFVATETTFTVNNVFPVKENRNISFDETRLGWLTGRRPVSGQVFPRGVYNK